MMVGQVDATHPKIVRSRSTSRLKRFNGSQEMINTMITEASRYMVLALGLAYICNIFKFYHYHILCDLHLSQADRWFCWFLALLPLHPLGLDEENASARTEDFAVALVEGGGVIMFYQYLFCFINVANIFELPSKDGNITPEKARKSRQMQFHDKTAYVWMGMLPLKKRVNRDKCSFATKQRMFGVFAIDEILRYRGTRFPHFMPTCSRLKVVNCSGKWNTRSER